MKLNQFYMTLTTEPPVDL